MRAMIGIVRGKRPPPRTGAAEAEEPATAPVVRLRGRGQEWRCGRHAAAVEGRRARCRPEGVRFIEPTR